MPLLGQVIGGSRGKGGLSQSSLSSKHDVSPVRKLFENVLEWNGTPPC
jgi:hypothetical protein